MTDEKNVGLESAEPIESYRVAFCKEEMAKYYKAKRKDNYKGQIKLLSLLVFMLILAVIQPSESSAATRSIAFILGMTAILVFLFMVSNKNTKKIQKKHIESSELKTQHFDIFEDHFTVNGYRGDEKVRYYKIRFCDIEKVSFFGDWLEMQAEGLLFLLPKSELKKHSVLFAYMYKNPSKVNKTLPADKWRTASIILFVASLVCFLFGMPIVSLISNINGLFTENMWVFFLLTPIPISSVIFGFILKAKGYKYKKNIIAGIIMTLVLCLYGCFVFMF